MYQFPILVVSRAQSRQQVLSVMSSSTIGVFLVRLGAPALLAAVVG
jgi:hypothetical protein